MNRFTVIVMTDSRDDSDAVVHAVSALGADKEAEQREELEQVIADRDRMVASAVAAERSALRKRVYSLKLGPVRIAPNETKAIKVESRFPFHATCLKVFASKSIRYFYITDLSFVRADDLTSREESVISNAVPAAVFSDEAMSFDIDAEVRAVKLSVSNDGKKPHVFRAYLIGFRSESSVVANVEKDLRVSHLDGPPFSSASNVDPGQPVATVFDPRFGNPYDKVRP
jgi:hypothetical protein